MTAHRSLLLIISLIFGLQVAPLKTGPIPIESDPDVAGDANIDRWVDSVMAGMSLEEKIGQLFMIRAHSDKGPAFEDRVEQLIKKYHVGGLCFFQGNIRRQAELTKRYQDASEFPLLIAMDAEWGLGMRLEDGMSFPRQLTLGAIPDNKLIYEMGREIGRQLDRLGVHMNFAPVSDINNNPKNPVINDRSFGESRINVASKAYSYMKGMQDMGILACAKHFPGHGDTEVDSHKDLPVIPYDRSRLDSLELYPFRILIDQEVNAVMMAHLQVPAIDSRPHMPTSLSAQAIDSLLRKELGFEGLVVSDAMEMQGVLKHFPTGEAEVRAVEAGTDIVLLPADVPKAFNALKESVQSGRLTVNRINQSVRRILRAKYPLIRNNEDWVKTKDVVKDINRPEAKALKSRLFEEALTLVRQSDQVIPFKKLENIRYSSLAIGTDDPPKFQKRLQDYTDVQTFQSSGTLDVKSDLFDKLSKADRVIVSFHKMSKYASRDFGLPLQTLFNIRKLSKKTELTIVLFGSPYALKFFDDFDRVIMAYQDDPMMQDIAAQSLFGVYSFHGKLPVTASARAPFQMGLIRPRLFRLGYNLPERVNMSSRKLSRIDSNVNQLIDEKAAPGCQILVARRGMIVFHKAYGHHTYSKQQAVDLQDMYDLASVTKIAAATLSIMKLYDEGKVDIYQPIGRYLPYLKGTDKEHLLLVDIMAHQAGLYPWIPFYRETLVGGWSNPRPDYAYYRKRSIDKYSVPVAPRLYLNKQYQDTIWKRIAKRDLLPTDDYRYSDLGFMLLRRLVQKVSGQSLDQYVEDKFYRPLGLQNITYNPWREFPKERMVPTEIDQYYRHRVLRGYVHDMGAAMLGGVSGHAGLFSTAHDLAVLGDLWLNGGYYGGQRYLDDQTISLFTRRPLRSSRRGVGFDMKQLNPDESINMAEEASEDTFGHLGFTGTCIWVDPDEQLVYVFLSNRTYPTMRNNELSEGDYRPKIQSAIYQSIKD